MTLGKGNILIKVKNWEPDTTFGERLQDWLNTHETNAVPTPEELSKLLNPGESYTAHEVMNDVHYDSHPDGGSFAPCVDLKVIY